MNPCAGVSTYDAQSERSSCPCGGACPKCQSMAKPDSSPTSAAPLPFLREMERSFGEDLSTIRAYTGRQSHLDSIGALAAAKGEDVEFRDGAPDRTTVAHEVTHVLQHRIATLSGPGSYSQSISDSHTPAEREASQLATMVARGEKVRVREPATAATHRLPEDLAPGQEPRRSDITQSVVPVTPIAPANEKHAKRIRKAVADMANGSDVIGRNTAHRVLDGDITVKLIEDLEPHPEQARVLEEGGLSPSDAKRALRDGIVYDVPGGNAPKYIPKTANNFYAQEISNTVFIRGAAAADKIKTGLVHEASHALNPDWSTPEQRFDTEARAYYVAEARATGGSNELELIKFAKLNVFLHYPDLKRIYDDEGNTSFRAYVDTWQPEGNLVNAPEAP